MTKMTMRCGNCSGENVMRDAWATWDLTAQAWVLGNVFDAAFCDDCEADATIVERPVTDMPEAARCG